MPVKMRALAHESVLIENKTRILPENPCACQTLEHGAGITDTLTGDLDTAFGQIHHGGGFQSHKTAINNHIQLRALKGLECRRVGQRIPRLAESNELLIKACRFAPRCLHNAIVQQF